MQSVCGLVSPDYFRQVVDLRASLGEDPAIGRIYDPPFVHFTLQLAEEYDWQGLERDLATLAKTLKPFELRTVGLLAFTGNGTGIAVAPYKDRQLAEFHAAVWETASSFAQGRVDQFYHPDRWIPHITIKRCGPHDHSFGHAIARLAKTDFSWTMSIDNVAVQHDPGKNSQTHYLRLRFPLGGGRESVVAIQTNATILQVTEGKASDASPSWTVTIKLDDGREVSQQWDPPTLVRIMAEAKSSTVHFPNARCRVEHRLVPDPGPRVAGGRRPPPEAA